MWVDEWQAEMRDRCRRLYFVICSKHQPESMADLEYIDFAATAHYLWNILPGALS